jgi:hypothetical protein
MFVLSKARASPAHNTPQPNEGRTHLNGLLGLGRGGLSGLGLGLHLQNVVLLVERFLIQRRDRKGYRIKKGATTAYVYREGLEIWGREPGLYIYGVLTLRANELTELEGQILDEFTSFLHISGAEMQ